MGNGPSRVEADTAADPRPSDRARGNERLAHEQSVPGEKPHFTEYLSPTDG